MQKHFRTFDLQQSNEFSSVYYYLMAGILILVAVFLFIPRVSVGT